MDIEQLKLILDAAAAAGDGAVHVVIVWFALQFTKAFLFAGLFGGAILTAFKLIRQGISHDSWEKHISGIVGSRFWRKTSDEQFFQWVREQHAKDPYEEVR